VRDSLGVLWSAVVLLARHWPVLLTIALFGSAAHDLFRWLAVLASRADNGLGLLVLILVPLALLVSLVLMMRTLRPSLPYLNRNAGGDAGSRRGLITVIASVAVPFLAIYTTYDYLKEDVSTYTYEVWRDSDPGKTLSRLPFTPTISIVCIVAIGIGLRWLFNAFPVRLLRVVTAPLGAYLEVLWLSTLAIAGNSLRNFSTAWLDGRQAGVWWHTFWDGLNSYYDPVRTVLEAFWHNFDVVVFAPIAWLALGAVVYGRQIPERRITDERLATAALRRAKALPGGLSFVAGGLTLGLYNRFAPLINSLRMLARAGLRPMLVFCIAFVVLQLTPQGVFEIERALIGPHDLERFWMPLSYVIAQINSAIRWMLIVCLVAAATDRLLESDAQTPPAEPFVPPTPVTSEPRTAEALTR
jgi:hypothetical protein